MITIEMERYNLVMHVAAATATDADNILSKWFDCKPRNEEIIAKCR